MLNRALESQLRSTEFFFTSAEIKGDDKQVESGETGNTSEQPEADLKTLTAKHQGTLQPSVCSFIIIIEGLRA